MLSPADTQRRVVPVIGVPIDAVDWDGAVARLRQWSIERASRVVCICNVHSTVTARREAEFLRVVREADMATPDGAPVAWLMRRLGVRGQQRINGPDLMWRYLADAQAHGQSVFFFGGTPGTLEALDRAVRAAFPSLRIAGSLSPPFRPLTAEEDAEVVRTINTSGAGTVWVSLGCPKQERWMAEHRGRIQAAMVGVGAAFDYHAGTIRRAPRWMQRCGLEWLFRLAAEPRRLWRRYLTTNSLFVWYAACQWLARAGDR